MFSHTKHVLILFAMLIGAVLLTACNGSATSNNVAATLLHNAPVARDSAVIIPLGQEIFTPFIRVVQLGTPVTWHNTDRVAHTITTTSEHSSFLNPQAFALHIPVGQTTSFTFHKAGLYNYFDNTQATWNSKDQRVAANKGVPNYPLAMEGVIWVQGPVAGLPRTVVNPIPGKDEFFKNFVAIPKGGSVSWHNTDMDDHFVSLVSGWSEPINPSDVGVIQIKGTHAHPGGETKTQTFSTPGLYYYYCSAHATVNTAWKRVEAHKDASETPLPMEGFILVTS
ncbi:MAG: plastocyanin/azurin family copper-binding protein [Ktedonobacteraceae bacterium]